MLRQIDPLLDLSDLRKHLTAYYRRTGRPSVDYELLIRMLIVGYWYGIQRPLPGPRQPAGGQTIAYPALTPTSQSTPERFEPESVDFI